MFYDAEPAADDAEGQALLKRFKGRRLPMVDRVEVSIINEEQPRWLSFLNGESDFVERVSASFIQTAMPGGKVAPNLAKRGIRGYQQVEPDRPSLLQHGRPVFGGYTPERIALRRAVGLALDTPREIRLLRKGQAIWRSRRCCRAPRPTTRSGAASSASSIRRGRRACSTSTAMSTRTATAGASSPTGSRSAAADPRPARPDAAARSTIWCRRISTRSASAFPSRSPSGRRT
jgi:hypothetical protein